MPEVPTFHHAVLNSHDPKRLAGWYCEMFGGRVVYENPAVTFLTYDEEHHRIGIAQLPGEPSEKGAGPGVQHLGWEYGSVRTLLEHYRNAKEAGSAPVITLHHGPSLSMYYKDPDGNNVEFFVDAQPTKQACIEFMSTPEFLANPAGILVDPDELLARLESGESEADLLRYEPDPDLDPEEIVAHTLKALA